MKLSDIIAELGKIKETLASLVSGKEKADAGALAALSARLDKAEASVSEQIAALGKSVENAVAENVKLSADLKSAQDLIAAGNGTLSGFLSSLNLKPKDGATLADNATAVTKSVSAALAQQGVKIEDLPQTIAIAGGDKGAGSLAQQLEKITDPLERSKFIQKNMDALQTEARAGLKAVK